MAHDPLFLQWANQALAAYDFEQASLTFIKHNENITFQVVEQATGEKYLLRLHRPIADMFVGVQQQPAAIASELCWLEALADVLPVQKPLPNCYGELVTVIETETGLLSCTILSWLEGELLPLSGVAPQDLAYDLGSTLGRLHKHASAWSPPVSFVRPVYDRAYFQRFIDGLQACVDAGVMTPSDYAYIRETAEMALDTLKREPEDWGLIHSDLHKNNCLVHERKLFCIDFSLCGFGYFAFDIATALFDVPSQARHLFFSGYRAQRALSTAAQRQIEACCLLSSIRTYVFLLPLEDHWPWLRTRTHEFAARECHNFAQGKPQLFEMMM